MHWLVLLSQRCLAGRRNKRVHWLVLLSQRCPAGLSGAIGEMSFCLFGESGHASELEFYKVVRSIIVTERIHYNPMVEKHVPGIT